MLSFTVRQAELGERTDREAVSALDVIDCAARGGRQRIAQRDTRLEAEAERRLGQNKSAG